MIKERINENLRQTLRFYWPSDLFFFVPFSVKFKSKICKSISRSSQTLSNNQKNKRINQMCWNYTIGSIFSPRLKTRLSAQEPRFNLIDTSSWLFLLDKPNIWPLHQDFVNHVLNNLIGLDTPSKHKPRRDGNKVNCRTFNN